MVYNFDGNVPEAIIGDPGKLRQILGNLLANAVKFTREGEVELDVSFDPDSNEIHISVRDTGIGIPQEEMGKLFLPFSQIESTLSRNYDGAGLGLAISRKLVELMGGKIWVESKVDEGSTFHFTVPAEAFPSEHKPFLTGGFRNKRVLIVEENHTLRRILGRQVLSWGLMPMVVRDPQEAVSLLHRDTNFDVVILDLSQTTDSFLTAENCKQWKNLPFVALTSLGQKVPTDLYDVVLTKPFKPAKLFKALQEVLEKGRQ